MTGQASPDYWTAAVIIFIQTRTSLLQYDSLFE